MPLLDPRADVENLLDGLELPYWADGRVQPGVGCDQIIGADNASAKRAATRLNSGGFL